jgi:NAD(P)-dependent dehydrogenase (short-subunit alcohol dehydrogenase family)
MSDSQLILITGATGYVGGRLVPRLLAAGYRVRCLARDPEDLRVGDTQDFWRVEMVEPGRLIRLRAEMRVPGRAWLQFEARSESEGQTLLLQTAFFEPKRLLGLLYWYALYPVHSLIFSGLIRTIAQDSAS